MLSALGCSACGHVCMHIHGHPGSTFSRHSRLFCEWRVFPGSTMPARSQLLPPHAKAGEGEGSPRHPGNGGARGEPRRVGARGQKGAPSLGCPSALFDPEHCAMVSIPPHLGCGTGPETGKLCHCPGLESDLPVPVGPLGALREGCKCIRRSCVCMCVLESGCRAVNMTSGGGHWADHMSCTGVVGTEGCQLNSGGRCSHMSSVRLGGPGGDEGRIRLG